MILRKDLFYLSEQNNDIKTYSPYPFIEDLGSKKENFYKRNKSETIEFEANEYYRDQEGKVIKDHLYFKIDTNEAIKNKFNCILYNTTYGNMPAIIGLGIKNYQIYKEYNFIEQLKSKLIQIFG